ncbi:uncharacterized protein LOC8067980 isoform X4 [Sorghum bicolor]|nr:uncharacterized protein LOC8067980 isoform X4 [Sorghum bicolor]XP_021320985.1 uncharacterized protein LOC8067980 isoform X4 [Sorghum bicolor]|eukprot:XP_021320984.1 uncharacterized protein LOC8067980 isoform X4 [Sorghum bicolor]
MYHEEEDAHIEDSPMSSNGCKSATGTSSSTLFSSPSKKSKSPMTYVKSCFDSWNAKNSTTMKSIDKNIEVNIKQANRILESNNKQADRIVEAIVEATRNKTATPMEREAEKVAKSVKCCQELAVQCGAAPKSVEYYGASMAFKDAALREFFLNIPTPKARLLWLKRYCIQNNLDCDINEAENPSNVADIMLADQRSNNEHLCMALLAGMCQYEPLYRRVIRRIPINTRLEWVQNRLQHEYACYNMFRMRPAVFLKLHDLLEEWYELKSTDVSALEALGMFLWMVGAPQSHRQVEDRFVRSLQTVSSTFDMVLAALNSLTVINPKDPKFSRVHPKMEGAWFYPAFNNCIGAIDGTHIPVTVPAADAAKYTGRCGRPTQNVMVCCDFDMRFTLLVARWPGWANDFKVFTETLQKYGNCFPHPPEGKFYAVDSGYLNRKGYLAPYRGVNYPCEDSEVPMQKGKKEIFNTAHASIRCCIERAFGAWKKWRILHWLPCYSVEKQIAIVLALCALHNFIRENDLEDKHFAKVEHHKNFAPKWPCTSEHYVGVEEEADFDMNALRDAVADMLFNLSKRRKIST